MSERALFSSNILDRLIGPHPAITDVARQRRARILAGLCFVLLVVSLPLLIAALMAGKGFPVSGWGVVGVIALSYGLSRMRWPEVGAGLVTAGLLLMAFYFLFAVPNPAITPQAMVFILLPVLFSTLVLTARYTVTLALAAVAGLTALVAAVPWLGFMDVIVPYAATVMLAMLAAAAAFVRERDMATIEQQAQSVDRYSQQLQDEVRRITTTAEVGQAIAATRDLDALLKQVVNLIVERFGYYHAQVFLLDESGRYAVLRQSTGKAGQQLLARGHRLAVGSRSVIGQVTARGAAVIASETDTDAIHQRNELLPGTRSEAALPLRVGGRIIGALDVQSVEPGAFTEADIPVLQTMADQLAIAIENSRLFEQAQRDLQDIDRLNRQLTGEGWQAFLAGRGRETSFGYRTDGQGLHALVAGDGENGAEGGGSEDGLSLPLAVRGETIGAIELHPRDGSPPPDEETRAILEAVAERVALALDSTRLSERAQIQAAREQILSRLSAALQATTDVNAMLDIAIQEASHALGTSRGFIQLTVGDNPERDGQD